MFSYDLQYIANFSFIYLFDVFQIHTAHAGKNYLVTECEGLENYFVRRKAFCRWRSSSLGNLRMWRVFSNFQR